MVCSAVDCSWSRVDSAQDCAALVWWSLKVWLIHEVSGESYTARRQRQKERETESEKERYDSWWKDWRIEEPRIPVHCMTDIQPADDMNEYSTWHESLWHESLSACMPHWVDGIAFDDQIVQRLALSLFHSLYLSFSLYLPLSIYFSLFLDLSCRIVIRSSVFHQAGVARCRLPTPSNKPPDLYSLSLYLFFYLSLSLSFSLSHYLSLYLYLLSLSISL